MDLFAGAGGWEEGLRSLGSHDSVGIESDPVACRTAEAAGHRRMAVDVATAEPPSSGELWGLIGSPPCQAIRQRVKAGRPWFRVELDIAAPILFRYFNASEARFVRNHANAVPLNNWLAIQPHPGVDVDALFAVLQSMKSGPLETHARHYGRGLWKLEPSELRDIKLPVEAGALRDAVEQP